MGSSHESNKISFFETGVEEMLTKLSGDASDEAEFLRQRASTLRMISRKWTLETPAEERRAATDDLFALYRQVMGRK